MPTPIARFSGRGLCAAVALVLSLACIVLAVAASTTPITGMVDMALAPTAVATTAAPATADGTLTHELISGAVGDVVRETASPVAWVIAAPMGSMCDSVCTADASGMCTAAAGLTLITMLALLFASRRDTFMGLLARTRPRALARRRRLQPPWTFLSPISLCVLRV